MRAVRSPPREEEGRVHEEPPASPSVTVDLSAPTTSGTAPPSKSRTVTTRAQAARNLAQRNVVENSVPPKPPVTVLQLVQDELRRATPAPSTRGSVSSATARMRQAELEAEERLAEIRKQELQLQASLIRKKLAMDLANIREEIEGGSQAGSEGAGETERRVEDWFQRSDTRGEPRAEIEAHTDPTAPPPRRPSPPRRDVTDRYPTTNRVTSEPRDRRERSFSPVRVRHDDRSIDRLTEALEKIVNRRPPPRQTMDLPIFSGAAGEWLPFKAAMKDTTGLHRFSPAENIGRLRSCLRGEAKEAVSALLYTATDPRVIMQTLEQCFGRPEVIIDSAFENIRKLPRLGQSTVDLNNFAIKFQNIVTAINCIDERGYLQNPMLVRQVIDKLTPHIKSKWCDYAEENASRSEPEIVTLSRFLMREADRAMRHSYSSTSQTPLLLPPRNVNTNVSRRPNERVRGKPVYATSSEEDNSAKKATCLCCGGEHETTKCRKLIAMPVNKRWDWARETRVCFRCLSSKHRRFTCRQKKCGIGECRQAHHALLHSERETEQRASTSKAIEEDVVAASARQDSEEQVYLKVCPVTIRAENGTQIETYALLDEGSTITLIDEEIAVKIGAQGMSKPLNIHGVTSSQREPDSRVVNIEVKGRKEAPYHSIRARTIKNLNVGSQTVQTELLKAPHLNRLRREEVCFVNARPRILIGADNWHLIVTRKLLVGKREQPAASYTKLGWIIHGSAPRSIIEKVEGSVLHVHTIQELRRREKRTADSSSNDELHEIVKAHFDIDALGVSIKRKTAPEVERALNIFNETARRVQGRFEVGLPWRTDDVIMPPSYDMALRRLKGIEKKMDKSQEFRNAYTAQIEGLLSKGYAAPCEREHEDDPRMWYLPHFAVTNPNKPGKIRLVFDAAARTNGKCLNDELLDGPDLLQALHGVLYRFRERAIAVTADIREMFLRVNIREKDRVAQHFLWRGENRQHPPQRYVMKSMIFGARSSPFLAHSVRNKNALELKENYPRAYEAITQNHYMDDWVESFFTESEAEKTIEEVRSVHGEAGFMLAGWDSNCEEILSGIPSADRARTPKELGASAHPYGKTLGILWLPATDELAFNTAMPRVPTQVRERERTPTKREALSVVMSLFDPLGLLSPYTITAKIILQGLWRQKVGWDEPLPHEESFAFDEWQRDLSYICKLRVPRCYDVTAGASARRQLHVFCDASEQAFAAVAYWRIEKPDSEVTVSLVAAKAKVAPLKAQSIPRMELQAALIGARLAMGILKEHRCNADVIYWSDSKTTLQWIKNDAARYTPFVAHRLAEIAELSRPEQWRWIPTDQNVADDATRAGNTRLTSRDRWFHGPRFLHENQVSWPLGEGDPEREVFEAVLLASSPAPVFATDRFSSYERLLRTAAYVLLFIERCKRVKREMSLDHLKRAESLLIKQAQIESFAQEVTLLTKKQQIGRTSRLYKLDPVLNEEGVMCLRGRIDRARVATSEMKNPPILCGSHRLSKLIIKREHEGNNHIGREHVINNIRQRYWVLRLRPTVRSILSKCTECKLRKASPRIPVKGNLPEERLKAYSRPFSQCGVDCFGPMWVTIGRRREKRWGMLFTCLVTRAIHVELIASLSTDSAIMAIRRMSARRGWPETIMSDNGTNFRGADVELEKAYAEWQPVLKDYLLTKRVNWKYIDPGAPNQGGAWERMVKSVKVGLATALKERAPREEILATLMAEIENTVNSRPLTIVSVEAEDVEALTPNHFLLGSATGLPTTGPSEIADKRAWRAALALADAFWQRWTREYLPTLTPRGDVRNRQENVKSGDIVLIVDGLLPRNTWPIGRVVDVFPGPDGVVRSAEVRARGGLFRRPVRRLVVLPIEEE